VAMGDEPKRTMRLVKLGVSGGLGWGFVNGGLACEPCPGPSVEGAVITTPCRTDMAPSIPVEAAVGRVGVEDGSAGCTSRLSVWPDKGFLVRDAE